MSDSAELPGEYEGEHGEHLLLGEHPIRTVHHELPPPLSDVGLGEECVGGEKLRRCS